MNSYIDIYLQPDSELNEAQLSSKVFTKFHKALVILNTNQIGISFPQMNYKLGKHFRIHGNKSLLNDLQGLDWLGPLKGYCKINEITPIPDLIKYRNISCKRSNMSNAKLKRLVDRKTIDAQGIKRYKEKMLSQGYSNPYLDLLSQSTNQIYRKFFEFGQIQDQRSEGIFDSYGLSKTATVPWF